MAQALGGSEHGVDLLRKESLSALSPAAARRVLVHSYTAIFPITPLPFPPLPSTAAPNGGASRPMCAWGLGMGEGQIS